eukprot:SAG31_NODE_4754_length_2976_cov_12.238790_2_plen_64_part_00
MWFRSLLVVSALYSLRSALDVIAWTSPLMLCTYDLETTLTTGAGSSRRGTVRDHQNCQYCRAF